MRSTTASGSAGGAAGRAGGRRADLGPSVCTRSSGSGARYLASDARSFAFARPTSRLASACPFWLGLSGLRCPGHARDRRQGTLSHQARAGMWSLRLGLRRPRGRGERFELSDTRNPAAEHWQRYQHQTLSSAEWQRIASGGLSNEAQSESDLVAAMTELQQGKVHLQPQAASPILLKAGELTLFVLPAVSLHEPRSVTRGAYGRPSVSVAKGLTLRVGGFQARATRSSRRSTAACSCCHQASLFPRSPALAGDELAQVDLGRCLLRRSRYPPLWQREAEFFFGLDHHTYSFAVQDRRYTEPMSGLILKYAIEGLLARPAAMVALRCTRSSSRALVRLRRPRSRRRPS